MSGRPTAEIVANMLEWSDSCDDPEYPVDVHREAANRLAELDAEVAGLTGALRAAEADADYWSDIADKYECSLPDCPTCGGKLFMPNDMTLPPAQRCPPCPENGGNCDGKVSIERLVAVFNAVHGPGWSVRPATAVDKYRYYLRSVR